MKKSKFLAAALAATMFATAACGLVACDKDAAPVIPGGPENPGQSQGTEYTITFSGLTGANATKQTTGGKLTGTMPTATAPEGKEFKGWARTANATAADITTSNYTSYTFSGTTTAITLYPVFANKQQTENPPENPTTEYTIAFDGLDGGSKTTTDGKLTGTMPTLSEEGKEFKGWALTAGATTPDITESNYTSYVFSGTATNITLYPVFESEEEYNPGELEATGYDIYADGIIIVNLEENSEIDKATFPTRVKEWNASDVEFTDGQTLTFTIEDTENVTVWLDGGKSSTLDLTDGVITVKAGGTYNVTVCQYQDQVSKGEYCVWIGIPGGGGGGDEESTAQPIGSSGVWLVGAGIPGGGWGDGVELIQDGSNWTATVYVTNEGWLKIRNGGTSDSSGTSWVANADDGYTKYPGDDNFWVNESGTYTFSFDGEKVTVTPA